MESINFFVMAIITMVIIAFTLIFGVKTMNNVHHLSISQVYPQIETTINEQIQYLYPQANGSSTTFSLPLKESTIVCFINESDYSQLKEMEEQYKFLLDTTKEQIKEGKYKEHFPNILVIVSGIEKAEYKPLIYVPASFCITKPMQKVMLVNYGTKLYAYKYQNPA